MAQQEREAAPLQPNKRGPLNLYAHVQSAIKLARQEDEITKLGEATRQV